MAKMSKAQFEAMGWIVDRTPTRRTISISTANSLIRKGYVTGKAYHNPTATEAGVKALREEQAPKQSKGFIYKEDGTRMSFREFAQRDP
jgi:hypothetical protein